MPGGGRQGPLLAGGRQRAAESCASALFFIVAKPSHASALRYQARNFQADASHRLTNTGLIFGDYFLLEALLAYDSALATHN